MSCVAWGDSVHTLSQNLQLILANREDGGTLKGSNTPGHIGINDDKLTSRRIMGSPNFSACNPDDNRILRGVVKRLRSECRLLLDKGVRTAVRIFQAALDHSGLRLPTHPARDFRLNSVHIEVYVHV